MLFSRSGNYVYNGTANEFLDDVAELYPLGIPSVTYNLLGGIYKDQKFEIVNQKTNGWSGLGEIVFITGELKQIDDENTLVKVNCRSSFSLFIFTILSFCVTVLFLAKIALSQMSIDFLVFAFLSFTAALIFGIRTRKSLLNRFVTCFNLKPSK